MPESATPDARALEELEEEWRRNPRSPTFYSLASRLFEAGRAQDAYDVLRQGLEIHRSHVEAQRLLDRVVTFLDTARGSRPGSPAALARVNVRSGVRSVEERVSRKVAQRHDSEAGPSKVSRHRPPAEDPFASDPSDSVDFPPPAATPWPRLTPESLAIARVRPGGTTVVDPTRKHRRILWGAIVLLLLAAGAVAFLIFQPL